MVAALAATRQPRLARRRRALLWLGAGGLLAALAAAALLVPGLVRPPRLPLAAGFVAAAETDYTQVDRWSCPRRIVCTRHGLSMTFCLVDPPRIKAFYISQTKITNAQYRLFAEAERSQTSNDWEAGTLAGERPLAAADHPDLPVFRVSCVEAARFAGWLGGQLPTDAQWDAAAGRLADEQAAGPVATLQPGSAETPKIAVDRADEGPLPAGAAADDLSPYGVRDMAGNGREWTRSVRDASVSFTPEAFDDSVSMILRGRSFADAEPYRFADLPENEFPTERAFDLGFRVVIDLDQLIDRKEP
jgi:hypothetical protein